MRMTVGRGKFHLYISGRSLIYGLIERVVVHTA
jgi:hypothetical protein